MLIFFKTCHNLFDMCPEIGAPLDVNPSNLVRPAESKVATMMFSLLPGWLKKIWLARGGVTPFPGQLQVLLTLKPQTVPTMRIKLIA